MTAAALVSDRCAALAAANAVVLGMPRRDVVARMNTMLPFFRAFTGPMTC